MVTVNHGLFLLASCIPPATYILSGAEKQLTHDANEMELYALCFVWFTSSLVILYCAEERLSVATHDKKKKVAQNYDI